MKKTKWLSGAMIFEICVMAAVAVMIFASGSLPLRTKRLPLLVCWITAILVGTDFFLALYRQFKMKDSSDASRNFDREAMKKTVGTAFFMVITIVLWNVLGFLTASILAVTSFSLFLGVKNKAALVISTVSLSFILYYVFGILLRVPLPRGLLL